MHISDVSMHRDAELARRGWTERRVSVKQSLERCYGALKGCLPWQLQQLFKILFENEDGAFIEYCVFLVLTRLPDNLGNLDHVSIFVHVRKAPAANVLQVFSVGSIIGCAHGIPEIATSSETGDGGNERWIVNSHKDLATWIDVYDYY
jgi:hypothetical protein